MCPPHRGCWEDSVRLLMCIKYLAPGIEHPLSIWWLPLLYCSTVFIHSFIDSASIYPILGTVYSPGDMTGTVSALSTKSRENRQGNRQIHSSPISVTGGLECPFTYVCFFLLLWSHRLEQCLTHIKHLIKSAE